MNGFWICPPRPGTASNPSQAGVDKADRKPPAGFEPAARFADPWTYLPKGVPTTMDERIDRVAREVDRAASRTGKAREDRLDRLEAADAQEPRES